VHTNIAGGLVTHLCVGRDFVYIAYMELMCTLYILSTCAVIGTTVHSVETCTTDISKSLDNRQTRLSSKATKTVVIAAKQNLVMRKHNTASTPRWIK
jgi:hypothetical protein